MAARGKGRGRGRGMSFNVESLGFGRGEALPGTILEPPPTYPALELKPVPLAASEQYDYLLALKQEFRSNIRESKYFIKLPEKRRDILRYSDKYQQGQLDQKLGEIVWSQLPSEIQPPAKKRRKTKAKSDKKKEQSTKINKVLDELEKIEGSTKEAEDEQEEEEETTKKKKVDEEEDEKEPEEEELEEEEIEDETDYAMNYFDNGENYTLDEDDDLDEGAIY